MAAAADHHSVTEDLLAGGGRFAGTFYLHEGPAVAHLDEGERPRFGFFDQTRGVGVGDDSKRHLPDTHGIAILLLTDRRVLALVGTGDGDRAVTLHYDVVTDVEYATGGFHHRLTVGTVEEDYHLWISPQFDESDLRGAAEFVRERMVDPDRLLDRATAGEAREGPAGSVASDGGLPGDGGSAASGPTGSVGGSGPSGSDGGPATSGDDLKADPASSADLGVGPTPSGTAEGPDAGPGSDPSDDPEEDPLARIERLHSLMEAGAISRSEYERKKADLLDRV